MLLKAYEEARARARRGRGGGDGADPAGLRRRPARAGRGAEGCSAKAAPRPRRSRRPVGGRVAQRRRIGARGPRWPGHGSAASRRWPRNAPPAPQTFEDVLALIDERRDIALKLDVEKFVRPISFRPGAIEFEPAPGAPATSRNGWSARLKEWTGEPWLIAAQGGGGAETLVERQTRRERPSPRRRGGRPLRPGGDEGLPGRRDRGRAPGRLRGAGGRRPESRTEED